MKLALRLSSFTFGLALLATPLAASAQTPDGQTPAIESVCDGLPGALFGLCNAYCEALDCDAGFSNPTACDRVLGNYLKHSGGPVPPCLNAGDTCEDKAKELASNYDYWCRVTEPKPEVCAERTKLEYERYLGDCEDECSVAPETAVCEDTWQPCGAVCQQEAQGVFDECRGGSGVCSNECLEKAGKVFSECYTSQKFGERTCIDTCTSHCQDDTCRKTCASTGFFPDCWGE